MSRRNDIINHIVSNIQAITTGLGPTDYTKDYREVTRDPIDINIVRKLQPGEACAGVYDIGEDKKRLFGATNSTLTVIVEFYYCPKIGQSKSEQLNTILAELTKCVMIDYQQGGLALNTEEAANSLDIDGVYDKIINGSITFEVTYRHGLFDPTKDLC